MYNRTKSPQCGTRLLLAKTCTRCGELQGAQQYRRREGRYYMAFCNPCQNRASRDSKKRSNGESLDKASKHYEKWTDREIEQVWDLTAQGLSNRQIAEKVGRTEIAIANTKSTTAPDLDSDVYLCYLDGDGVRTVGTACRAAAKGSRTRLLNYAQTMVELYPQRIFFVQTKDESTEHWKEVIGMGLRGIDALKQGDDREPEDTSENKERTPAPTDA